MRLRAAAIVLLLALDAAAPAESEIPCGVMQAVRVRTSSRTLAGYVIYDSSDVGIKIKAGRIGKLEKPPSLDRVHAALLASLSRGADYREIMPKAFRIRYPHDTVALSDWNGIRISTSEILDIEPVDDPINGVIIHETLLFNVDGDNPKNWADLLQKKPIYSCRTPAAGGGDLDYWVSYNARIGSTQLDPICNGSTTPTTKLPGVIHLLQPGS